MEYEIDEISQKVEQNAKGIENEKDMKIRGLVHED